MIMFANIVANMETQLITLSLEASEETTTGKTSKPYAAPVITQREAV